MIAYTLLGELQLMLITPEKHYDDRGFFSEIYNRQALADIGYHRPFVQDNHSFNVQKGTVRGLHFQRPPHAQDKLVHVLQGRILDVAVDIRRGSPTYGRHVATELSAQNGSQLLVPAGFAHGFCTLEPGTHVSYKVSDYYAAETDAGLRWNDPVLAIDWPVTDKQAFVSEKDQNLPGFSDFDSPFIYGE